LEVTDAASLSRFECRTSGRSISAFPEVEPVSVGDPAKIIDL
jgi:hypothetical protein